MSCLEIEETGHDVFFKSDTHILEINSKTGLYPLYVAFSTYMAKCQDIAQEELTLEKQRELWFETVTIFILNCLKYFTKMLS